MTLKSQHLSIHSQTRVKRGRIKIFAVLGSLTELLERKEKIQEKEFEMIRGLNGKTKPGNGEPERS